MRTSGSKGHEEIYDPSAAFRFEVPGRACRNRCRNFKSGALVSYTSQITAALAERGGGQNRAAVAEAAKARFNASRQLASRAHQLKTTLLPAIGRALKPADHSRCKIERRPPRPTMNLPFCPSFIPRRAVSRYGTAARP